MKLKIEIDARAYEVEVEVTEEDYAPGAPSPRMSAPTGRPPRPSPLPSPLAPTAPTAASDGGGCKSPIAGLVVKVLASVGQRVAMNDPLLVLEAMKMESNITAPADGTVTRILVKQGDAVQTGQTLVELE